jgi:hypothetical protein
MGSGRVKVKPEVINFMDTERMPASPPDTGDPRVDQAIAGLAALDELPLDEHPAVLEEVHDQLRGILGELGEPGRPGRPGEQAELGGDPRR